MGVNVLACDQCGAGLLPPDHRGSCACVYCGAEYRSGRSSDILRAALTPSDRPSWHECADATCIPLTDDAVLGLLRQHFVHTDGIYVCPHVPPAKELAARRLHAAHLPAYERVLALYDASPLGDGDGFLLTARRVCWKNPGGIAASIEWCDLDAEELLIEGDHLVFGFEAITIPEEAILASALDAFHVLALSGAPRTTKSGLVFSRGASESSAPSSASGPRGLLRSEATRPPPHTTSYFAYAKHAQRQRPECACWRCQTPLYESTPQCAYCGAAPTKTGWQKTG